MTGKDPGHPRRPLAVTALGALTVALLGLGVWAWRGLPLSLPAQQGGSLEGLQDLGALPDFSLTERSSRRITLTDLRGKVWIADFIYTHCTDTCPLQNAEMARLQAEFSVEPGLRLVSITVDPAEDTPAVLSEYAARFGADRLRWLFLTGKKEALYALARDGFHLSIEGPDEIARPAPRRKAPSGRADSGTQESNDRAVSSGRSLRTLADELAGFFTPAPAFAHSGHLGTPFLHSSWFVLVDRQAHIRGYYQSDDGQAIQRLRRDVRILLREP
jgi:cytochrome oxidase Cu insertion factor (SCO1/SenC/PrrC family)